MVMDHTYIFSSCRIGIIAIVTDNCPHNVENTVLFRLGRCSPYHCTVYAGNSHASSCVAQCNLVIKVALSAFSFNVFDCCIVSLFDNVCIYVLQSWSFGLVQAVMHNYYWVSLDVVIQSFLGLYQVFCSSRMVGQLAYLFAFGWIILLKVDRIRIVIHLHCSNNG